MSDTPTPKRVVQYDEFGPFLTEAPAASARTLPRYRQHFWNAHGVLQCEEVCLWSEVAPLLTALADHAQAVQTLATALRAIHAHPTYALDQILAVADRLDALAGSETPSR